MRRVLAALLVWLALAAPALAAIGTPVALGSNSDNSTTTTKVVTTVANINAGDLVLCVWTSNNTLTPTFADSGAVNVYTVVSPNSSGANSVVYAYVANASAVASGGTITATYASTAARKGMTCVAVSGIATANARDTLPASTTTSFTTTTTATNINTGALTNPKNILFAGVNTTGGTNFGTLTPPGNWLEAVAFDSQVSIRLDYQITTSPSSVGWAPTWGTAVTGKSWAVGAFIGLSQPTSAGTGGMMGVVP
jgi:hypothetical protein